MIERLFFNNKTKNTNDINAIQKNPRFKIKYSDASCFERTPNADTIAFKGISKDERIKDVLDNKAFEFKNRNGEVFIGTIRDYLKDSLVTYSDIDPYSLDMIHCSFTKESATQMIREGAHWERTGRRKCGPGTYFTGSVAMAGCYGASMSAAVQARYIGDKRQFPSFKSCFYEAIENNLDIRKTIKGIDANNEVEMTLAKYCHDFLQNEMDVDVLMSYDGAGPCYVVINDDCVRLQRYQQ